MALMLATVYWGSGMAPQLGPKTVFPQYSTERERSAAERSRLALEELGISPRLQDLRTSNLESAQERATSDPAGDVIERRTRSANSSTAQAAPRSSIDIDEISDPLLRDLYSHRTDMKRGIGLLRTLGFVGDGNIETPGATSADPGEKAASPSTPSQSREITVASVPSTRRDPALAPPESQVELIDETRAGQVLTSISYHYRNEARDYWRTLGLFAGRDDHQWLVGKMKRAIMEVPGSEVSSFRPRIKEMIEELRFEGDIGPLLDHVKKYRSRYPGRSSELREQIAALAFASGDLSGAHAAFEEVLAAEPDHLVALGFRGHLHLLNLELDDAKEAYRNALEIAREKQQWGWQALTLSCLGRIETLQHNYDRAADIHREALELEKQLDRTRGIALETGNLGLIARLEGRVIETEKLYRAALDLETKSGHSMGRAEQSFNLASILMPLGFLEEAEKLYGAGLEIEEGLGWARGIANNLSGLGVTSLGRNKVPEAEDYLSRALEVERHIGRVELIANHCNNLGQIYLSQGKLEQSEDMYRKALLINTELGRTSITANQYGNLGWIYQKQSDLDRAEEMYTRSRRINESLGRAVFLARDYSNLGGIYLMRSEYARAETTLNQALLVNRRLNRTRDAAENLRLIGVTHAAREMQAAAEQSWRESLQLFLQVGDQKKAEQVNTLLRSLEPMQP